MVSATRYRNPTTAASPADARADSPASAAGGGFVCPVCKCRYGDPLYHGPAGHAPEGMCFDCWASEWGSMVRVVSRGGNWRPVDSALFLMCQGFTHKQAADLAGICRRALHNWIRDVRQRPHLAPQWLIDRACARQRVRV